MKSVLITGANRGLGLALAHTFHNKGFWIYAVVRTKEAQKQLRSTFSHSSILVADITDQDYQQRLLHFLNDAPLSLLINNAGSAGTPGINLASCTSEHLLYEFNTHCIGALASIKASLESLKRASPSGMIINISSRRGSLTMQSNGAAQNVRCAFSYRIAKTAQNMLSLCIADDVEALGIRVVSVHPGALLTDMAPADAILTPTQAAEKLLTLVENNTLNTREFICLESGEKLPW